MTNKINRKEEEKNRITLWSTLIVVLNFGVFYFSWVFFSKHGHFGFDTSFSVITYTLLFITYIALFIFFINIYDALAFGRRKIIENIYSLTLSCLLTNFIFYFLDTLAFRKFYPIWYILIASIIQLIINSYYCKHANTVYFKDYKPKKSLIIYREEYDLLKLDYIPFFEKKFNIVKKIENPKSYRSIASELNEYEMIFISGIKATLRNGIIKHCVNSDIETYVVPHVGDIIVTGGKYIEELPVPMLSIDRAHPNRVYLFSKRCFDIFVAGCATIVLLPFMLVTALAIKLYDGGPVLYKQVRLTKDRKKFTILKFRSMKVDAEKEGVARLVSEKDNRITPIGRIIRAIRFDELPQVFNILKGDMSIVGPRPERPEIAEQYEKIYPSFKLRLQVKAGLTGYAQIYGKYNTEPIDKLKMDLYYINKMSFLYDIQLCFMTVKTLFMKESTAAIEEGKVIASKGRDSE